MWVGANARVRMFGGFVILPSHFGVPVASHGGNGEPLHTGCRSPSIDSKHQEVVPGPLHRVPPLCQGGTLSAIADKAALPLGRTSPGKRIRNAPKSDSPDRASGYPACKERRAA